jgi:F-type H+-transporting ATPase subunit b
MPQFDFTTYSSQIFWLLICILAIYFTMAKIILPRIADIFEQRKENIDDNLSNAKSINDDVVKIKDEIKKLRSKILEEYKQKIELSAKEINQLREEKNSQLKQEINKMNAESKNNIEQFLKSSKLGYDLAVDNIGKAINNKIFGSN